MNKAIVFFAMLISPLIAQEAECPNEQCRPYCRGCHSRCWYFDMNYDYHDERDQEAYWPSKNESYLYDFLTR